MDDDFPSAAAPEPAEAPDGAVRQRRKEARPAELLAAALEVFAEKCFAATRPTVAPSSGDRASAQRANA